MTNLTLEALIQITEEAQTEAHHAAKQYFDEALGGQDQFACGFAWVEIFSYNGQNIKGNTKIGKMLKKIGITQDYQRIFQVWNPARFGCQNVDTLEVGARAYAEVLKRHGFTAYAGSRLD